jgi:formylglycine-generating enzyme required for sulfatase activity
MIKRNKILNKHYIIILLMGLLIISIAGCSKSPGNETDSDSTPLAQDTDKHTDDTSTEIVVSTPDINWIKVDAGTFVFGSPETTPCRGPAAEIQVNVQLTHPFVMAETELTQKQWTALGYNNPVWDEKNDNLPVTMVNFYEAAAWCNKLSEFEGLETCYDLSTCTGVSPGKKCPKPDDTDIIGCGALDTTEVFSCTGNIHKFKSYYDCKGYRLPTTAEWEYAARGGIYDKHTYGGDVEYETAGACSKQNSLEDIAWYCNNSDGVVHPVAKKKPNPWGFYDMLGNLYEMVDYFTDGPPLDVSDGHPDAELLIDPTGTPTGNSIDIRGWRFNGTGCNVRPSYQMPSNPEFRTRDTGFRPVRTVFE